MTTIINSPTGAAADDGVGAGFVLGKFFLIIIAGFPFFFYGLPMFYKSEQPTAQKIEMQNPTSATTQSLIVVPSIPVPA